MPASITMMFVVPSGVSIARIPVSRIRGVRSRRGSSFCICRRERRLPGTPGPPRTRRPYQRRLTGHGSVCLCDLIENNLPDRADKTALVLDAEPPTRNWRAGRRPSRHGCTSAVSGGDRVAVHLHKSIEEVVVTFAVARLGAIIVNVSYQRSVPQLSTSCTTTGEALYRSPAGVLAERRGRCEPSRRCRAGPKPDGLRMRRAGMTAPERQAPASRPVDGLASLLHLRLDGHAEGGRGDPPEPARPDPPRGGLSAQLRGGPHSRAGVAEAPWGLLQVTTMFLRAARSCCSPCDSVGDCGDDQREAGDGHGGFPVSWIEMEGLSPAEPPDAVAPVHHQFRREDPLPTLEALPGCCRGKHLPDVNHGSVRSTVLPPERFPTDGLAGRPCRNVDVFIIEPVKGLVPANRANSFRGAGDQRLLGRSDTTAKSFRPASASAAHRRRDCPLQRRHRAHDDEGFYGLSSAPIRLSSAAVPCEPDRWGTSYSAAAANHVMAFGVEDDTLGQVVHIAVSAEGAP